MNVFCVHCQYLHSDPRKTEPYLGEDFTNSMGLSVWSLIWPSSCQHTSPQDFTCSLHHILLYSVLRHFHFPDCPGKFDRALIMGFELQISISVKNSCILSGCTHSYQLKKHDVNYEIDEETGKLGGCMK